MLPAAGNDLRGNIVFGELPTPTYGLRLYEREHEEQAEEEQLYVLDGATPAFVHVKIVDGGSPSTLEGLKTLYDGGVPRRFSFTGGFSGRADWDGVLSGVVDGLEAMRQAVLLILSIERYKYIIYSWNYGVELDDLFGKPMPFVMPEVKRRITEALMQDTRVTGVTGFEFEPQGRALLVRFTARTVYGEIEAEKAVTI